MPSNEPLENAPNLNLAWAGLLMNELARLGVTDLFLCPGSRSTPLALAAAAQPDLRLRVHYDERGAAFAALGCGRAQDRPAAFLCTSGSAVANALPAVMEASQSHTPLLVITADRPPELIDCGANQAVLQPGLFGPYVRWSADLPCPSVDIPPAYVLSTADQAVYRTRAPYGGPVHLNCPFREPLAPLDAPWPKAWLHPLARWLGNAQPHTHYHRAQPLLDEAAEQILLSLVARERHGLLVLGQIHGVQARHWAAELVRRAPWPVAADILSGVRTGVDAPRALAAYDHLLLEGTAASAWQPEFVLHVGGAVTSKRLQQRIAAWAGSGTPVIRVADHPLRHDPDHLATHRFLADIAHFCEWLAPIVRPLPPVAETARIMALDAAAAEVLKHRLEGSAPLNELTVARGISRMRPEHSNLFLGNSMPVRDMDMYADPDGSAGPVFANRGASGIDGNIATAAGIALATKRATTVVLGDLATLHDLNSLALLQGLETPFALIVLNNDGGGIFSFLPVHGATPHFERLFGTPHGMNFQRAAAQFGLAYAAPQDLDAFTQVYTEAMQGPGPCLIEVRTRRDENLAAHRAVQDAVRAALPPAENGS